MNTDIGKAILSSGAGYASLTSGSNYEATITVAIDHVYLIVIVNSYNVGNLFFVESGHSVGTARVNALINDAHFQLTATNQTTLHLEANGAFGSYVVIDLGTHPPN